MTLICYTSQDVVYPDRTFEAGSVVKVLSRAAAFDKNPLLAQKELFSDGVFVVFYADPKHKLRTMTLGKDGTLTMIKPFSYWLCIKSAAKWVFSSPRTYLLFPIIPIIAAVDYYEAQDPALF